mmetsp:Transcript_26709/g.40958  ORF Transcript_26709/g.40958 Transcript_26709/m.40958 type:complete len:180 (+) Transcript_26709:1-540(+)
MRYFSSKFDFESSSGVAPDDMAYLHHHHHHHDDNDDNPRRNKFKNPRKRASKLLFELNTQAIEQNKTKRPDVLNVRFNAGDAIEILRVAEGGAKSTKLEKIRGVVLGKFNRGLDTSVCIRDVVHGEPVERRIPLHSPLLRSIKVLEQNFVYKGKRRVKRAKLYFLRDRLPIVTQVTKRK